MRVFVVIIININSTKVIENEYCINRSIKYQRLQKAAIHITLESSLQLRIHFLFCTSVSLVWVVDTLFSLFKWDVRYHFYYSAPVFITLHPLSHPFPPCQTQPSLQDQLKPASQPTSRHQHVTPLTPPMFLPISPLPSPLSPLPPPQTSTKLLNKI